MFSGKSEEASVAGMEGQDGHQSGRYQRSNGVEKNVGIG